MIHRKKDISDRQLTVFLILAIFISLISVWTVLVSLDFNLLRGESEPQKVIVHETVGQPITGQVSLIIKPNPVNKELFKNATIQ